MSDETVLMIGLICFYGGWAIGWLLNRKPKVQKIVFEVNPAAMRGLNLAIVQAWLDGEGLTWMPKGMPNKDKINK